MNRESQCDQILDYIKSKGSITSMEAFRELSCTRLSGRIFDLRERGEPIETEWVGGDGVRYARYSLKAA